MTQTKPDPPSTRAIKSLIQAFFDAINAADTVALGSHFFPSATLTILRQDPPRAPDEEASSSQTTSFSAAPSHPCPCPPSSPTAKVNEPDAVNGNDEEKEKPKEKDSITPVLRTTIEAFIALLDAGKKKRENSPRPQPVIYEEPDLEATSVRVEGLFGSAWSPFRVMFDGALHHYGVLVFALGWEGEGWRIEGLTQSYRRTVGWEAEREFV